MYDQEPTNRARLASMQETEAYEYDTPKEPASNLQRALNEHGEQLEKLHALAITLSDRLQPVRIDVENPAEGLVGGEAMNATQPVTSPIVNQITLQTQSVKNLQRKLDQLLQQLEV